MNSVIDYDSFRGFVESCQNNWDCDEDAHKHSTECRSCTAKALLERYPEEETWIVSVLDKTNIHRFTLWKSYEDALKHAVKEWRAAGLGYDDHAGKFYRDDSGQFETRYDLTDRVVEVMVSGCHIFIHQPENV